MSDVKKKAIVKQTPAASIEWGLLEAKCLDFQLTSEGKALRDPIKLDDYEYRFNIVSNINIDEKYLTVTLDISVLHKLGKTARVELATIKTLTKFNIVNIKDVVMEHDGIQEFPELLFALTYGAAFATSRGMLVLKVEHTPIHNAITPLIDATQLISGLKSR